jgi:hypothetical protein
MSFIRSELNTLLFNAVMASSKDISRLHTPCNYKHHRSVELGYHGKQEILPRYMRDLRLNGPVPEGPFWGSLPRGDAMLMDMSVLAVARIMVESQIKWHDCGTDMTISLQDLPYLYTRLASVVS